MGCADILHGPFYWKKSCVFIAKHLYEYFYTKKIRCTAGGYTESR
jgi:hypothetical protein